MEKTLFQISLLLGIGILFMAGCTQTPNVETPSNNTVLVPEDYVAVIVPAVEITPDAPQVIFIGITTIAPLDISQFQGRNSNIVVTFTEAMKPDTINQTTFTVKGSDNVLVEGVITSDSSKKVWTFNPTTQLGSHSTYTVTVNTEAVGVSGNSLIENFIWRFTTISASTGSGSTGTSGVTHVLTTLKLSSSTLTMVNGATRQLIATKLDQNGAPMAATVAYVSSNTSVATVSASGLVTALSAGTTTINISSGTISNSSVMTVTPIVPAYTSAAAVDLGAANSFAILSYAGVSSTPTSHISGDIGAYPISGTALVLDCTEIVAGLGSIYSSDAASPAGPTCTLYSQGTILNTAMTNLGTAYTTGCNGQAVSSYGTNIGAGELSGLTIYPGVYAFTNNVAISGDVYLYGNSTNDVWIFQIPGTLTMAASTHIFLEGNAQAKNVFFTVAGATMIGGGVGTESVFNGNILGHQGIEIITGSTVNGRLFSNTGSVTLDQNIVTRPAI